MSHPHAPADLLREGYCVDFTSRYTGSVCFQSITGAKDGILRSTVRGIEIAFWPGPDEASAWLKAMDYRPGDPVPVGVGHMRIGLRPFAHHLVDPEWCRGTLFEVPAALHRSHHDEPDAAALQGLDVGPRDTPVEGLRHALPVGAAPPGDPDAEAVRVGLPERADREARPYRPSNGTEGALFMSRLCERGCTSYRNGRCPILRRSLLFDLGHPRYPREWCHGDDGRPTCTAFDCTPPRPRNRIRPARTQATLF